MYTVEITYNNGYHCCCHRTDVVTKLVESKEEALALIPKSYEPGDWEVENVEVRDNDQKLIAWGQLEWVYGRGYYYSHTRWFGEVNGEKFCEIRGLEPGETTWEQLLARIDEEKQKRLASK